MLLTFLLVETKCLQKATGMERFYDKEGVMTGAPFSAQQFAIV